MEKEKEQHQHLKKQEYATKSQARSSSGGQCSNCGAHVAPGARFCEECGAPQGSARCQSCGAEISPDVAICPHCGHPATMECTYCGAQMSPGERFCPECGNPRGGILCPRCNTLNFRSFCRKCNQPLNQLALEAIERVKANPRYKRAAAIAQEVQDLEDEIAQLEAQMAQDQIAAAREPERVLDVDTEMSEATRRLMAEFEKMSGETAPAKPKPEAPKPQAPKPQAPGFVIEKSGGPKLDLDSGSGGSAAFAEATRRLAELKSKRQELLKEFQTEMEALVPDPSAPPAIQRNEACAMMITTVSKTKRKETVRVAWVCNQCHIWHNNPSECGVREFGGKWVTQDRIVEVETISSGTVNI